MYISCKHTPKTVEVILCQSIFFRRWVTHIQNKPPEPGIASGNESLRFQSRSSSSPSHYAKICLIMAHSTSMFVQRLYLPPMELENGHRKEARPSPSSRDNDVATAPKRPKNYNDNPFDMLHLECFTYVMSALGERGLTMCAAPWLVPYDLLPSFLVVSDCYVSCFLFLLCDIPTCGVCCLEIGSFFVASEFRVFARSGATFPILRGGIVRKSNSSRGLRSPSRWIS